MESIHANVKSRIRVRAWQDALAKDGAETAEAVVLGYVLAGWLSDLDYRLAYRKPYTGNQDRYFQLQQTIAYINWTLDRMAELLPDGATMVQGSDRAIFELVRDAGYDLSFRSIALEDSAIESFIGSKP